MPTRWIAHAITRRECLVDLVKTVVLAPALLSNSKATAASPLPPFPSLPESEALLLTPGARGFAEYQSSYNRRTQLEPKLRALCRTPSAVSTLVQWLRSHRIPFAVRSGGHCFEGYSQSSSVVVDVRMMDGVDVDAANQTVTVGPGARLGAIYQAIAAHGYALPAGTCPTVGVAGHALGGGYGLLSRSFGLLCDNLKALEIVDPDGSIIVADDAQNADLFWACRGGGGGCFGIVTRLQFRLVPVSQVIVFTIRWSLTVARALNVVRAWQEWAPHAPDALTSMLRIETGSAGRLDLWCAGQSVGSELQLHQELQGLIASEAAEEAPVIKPMSFLEAVDHFSEGWAEQSVYSKDKSDFIFSSLSADGIATLLSGLQELRAEGLTVTFYACGGCISRVAVQDSAFPYRTAASWIQYDLIWDEPAEAAPRLSQLRGLYRSMRPYVSGAAYVNFSDSELENWEEAYWGRNLKRLKAIKSRFDPDNVFRHGQSISPAVAVQPRGH